MEPEAPAQYAPDNTAPPPAPCAWAVPVPHHKPAWTAQAVGALQAGGHLPARAGRAREIHLNVWSDCSGINSEMFALREIGAQLLAMVGIAVRWVLHCTCDFDPKSCRFSMLNHGQMHVSDWMEHRNMETNTSYRGMAWTCTWARFLAGVFSGASGIRLPEQPSSAPRPLDSCRDRRDAQRGSVGGVPG